MGRLRKGAVVVVTVLALAGIVAAVYPRSSASSGGGSGVGERAAPGADAGGLGAPSATRAVLGEVVDAAGAPVSAVVRLVFADRTETVRSDVAGAFAFEGVVDPVLALRFDADGFVAASVEGERLGAGDLFWSQRLERVDHDHHQRGSAPVSARGDLGRIEGVVVDDRGAPVTSFTLSALRIGPAETIEGKRRSRAFDDERGRFAMELEPAGWLVDVAAPDHRPVEPREAAIVAGAAVELRFVLEKSNALHGVVRERGTRAPVEGATVAVKGNGGQATTDVDGRFVIRQLPRERFSIDVSRAGFKKIVVGGIHGDRSRDEHVEVELTRLGTGSDADERTDDPGEFVGIGVTVDGDERGLVVKSVFADGPSAHDLKVGDIVVEVDGMSLERRSTEEAMAAVRGQLGTRARVVVQRAGERLSFDLERQRLATPPPKRRATKK